jgi:hypothetical protein
MGVLAAIASKLRMQYFGLVRISQRLQPWMLVSAAWTLPAGFAVVNRIAQIHLSGWDPVTTPDLLWEGGYWLLYAFLTPAIFVISKRLPLAQPQLTRRALLHLVISFSTRSTQSLCSYEATTVRLPCAWSSS